MDPLYVQVLLLFAGILLTGILLGLLICALSNESLDEALCGCMKQQPRTRRRTTIGPNGEVAELEEVSTETYDGPPLDPVSREKEKREPLPHELEWMAHEAAAARTAPQPHQHHDAPHDPHAASTSHGHHH